MTLPRQFESCEVFRAEGLPTLRPVLLTNMKQVTEQLVEKVRPCSWCHDGDGAGVQVARVLGLPCIVKPNRGCGGRGVYRVDQAADLRHFIGLAFKHDTQVLVEPFIEDGIEVRRNF